MIQVNIARYRLKIRFLNSPNGFRWVLKITKSVIIRTLQSKQVSSPIILPLLELYSLKISQQVTKSTFLLKAPSQRLRNTLETRLKVHRLQHFTARLIQNGQQGLKKGQTLGYWTLQSIFAKKVFDSIIPSTIITSKSKMATRGPQNGRRDLESVLPLDFWALPSTFAK